MKFFIFVFFYFFNLFSFAQNSRDLSLESFNIEIKNSLDNLPVTKKYGVSYSLKGVIKTEKNDVLFYTKDGRIFKLDMDLKEAIKYENKSVEIYAKAIASDNLSLLKVKEIKEYNPAYEIILPDFQNKRKPLSIISKRGGEYLLRNIRWHPEKFEEKNYQWLDFKVDVSKLKDVYFVKKPFTPEIIAAHSLLLFKFEKGGVVAADGKETDSIVLSIEAYLREGESYSLVQGMKDKFNIIWLFATWKDYSYRTILFDKDSHSLILYPVKLTLEQKKEVLDYAINQAAVNRSGEYYNTITNNCTNNLVILMNKALPENKKIKLWEIPYLVYNIRATMPNLVTDYLESKGLLGPEVFRITSKNYTQGLP